MKIFLTGGTGFVGSHFVQVCQNEGIELVLLARATSHKFRIPLSPSSTTRVLTKTYSELEPSDFENIDILVHLATHSSTVPYDNLRECLLWNVSMPLLMLEKAYQGGVRKYISIGSCFEYGRSGLDYQYIPANAPLYPTQSYPTSKAAASLAFTQWAIENKLFLKILRLFQVYGPGEHSTRLWPSLIQAMENNNDFEMTLGEQLRDFSHVKDIAEKLLQHVRDAMRSSPMIIHQNLGSGNFQTIADFAKMVWGSQNTTGILKIGVLPYRDGEVMRYLPDTSPKIILEF